MVIKIWFGEDALMVGFGVWQIMWWLANLTLCTKKGQLDDVNEKMRVYCVEHNCD